MEYITRINETETSLVNGLSEEYKDHVLIINYKGDLAILNITSGLMICDYNIIIFKYGKTSFENWKSQVDYALGMIENNEQNVIINTSPFSYSCGIMDENYAPEGKIQNVLEKYKFPTLIEPYENEYRVVGQDSCSPLPLFYGSYDECVKWKQNNCKYI